MLSPKANATDNEGRKVSFAQEPTLPSPTAPPPLTQGRYFFAALTFRGVFSPVIVFIVIAR